MADLNSTLSAQRNTGSASNKNYRRPEKVASAAEASGGRLQPSSRSKRDFFQRSRRKGAGGWSPYRGPEHSGLCVCEGGSGILVLARRRYLYFLPWVGARECRPVCQAATKTTLAYRKKLLAQWSRCEGVYQPSRRSKRDFFRRSGGKEMEWMVLA